MGIEITGFREFKKNTLRGFFSIRMTTIGLEIKDATLHESNGSRWIGLPARPYEKEDGTKSWVPIVLFFDKQKHKAFQQQTLRALDEHMGRDGQ